MGLTEDDRTGVPISPRHALWPSFTTALTAAGLPVADLHQPGQRFFAFADGAAFGGYARSGELALLRSLVVIEPRRQDGLGGLALSGLLDHARGDGARAVWLLTTSASGFFARHGFAVADRGDAPAAVAASAQFTSLCPASAVLMCRKPV